VPERIIDRRKKGFGVPVGAWFAAGKLGIDPAAMPCPGVAERLQSEHRSGAKNHRLFLWNAWVYGEWRKNRPR
jgi:asparagine synthase (glutamine-hydrolysing)